MQRIFTNLVILSALLYFTPTSAHSAPTCATASESEALAVRALGSSLMVAALSCGQHDGYNKFVHKYQPLLVKGGSHIKEYFHRIYGSTSEWHLNQFITRLANQASQGSMSGKVELYCSKSLKTFDEVMGLNQKHLIQYSMKQGYASLHGIKPCHGSEGRLAYNQ